MIWNASSFSINDPMLGLTLYWIITILFLKHNILISRAHLQYEAEKHLNITLFPTMLVPTVGSLETDVEEDVDIIVLGSWALNACNNGDILPNILFV